MKRIDFGFLNLSFLMMLFLISCSQFIKVTDPGGGVATASCPTSITIQATPLQVPFSNSTTLISGTCDNRIPSGMLTPFEVTLSGALVGNAGSNSLMINCQSNPSGPGGIFEQTVTLFSPNTINRISATQTCFETGFALMSATVDVDWLPNPNPQTLTIVTDPVNNNSPASSLNKATIRGSCESSLGDVSVSGDFNESPLPALACNANSYQYVNAGANHQVTLQNINGPNFITATQLNQLPARSAVNVDQVGPLLTIDLPYLPLFLPAVTVGSKNVIIQGNCETSPTNDVLVRGEFSVGITAYDSTDLAVSCVGGRYLVPNAELTQEGLRTVRVSQQDDVGNQRVLDAHVNYVKAPQLNITNLPDTQDRVKDPSNLSVLVVATCTNGGSDVTITGPASAVSGPCVLEEFSGSVSLNNSLGSQQIVATQTAQGSSLMDTVSINLVAVSQLAFTSPAPGTVVNNVSVAVTGICTEGAGDVVLAGLNTGLAGGDLQQTVNATCDSSGEFSGSVLLSTSPNSGVKNIYAVQSGSSLPPAHTSVDLNFDPVTLSISTPVNDSIVNALTLASVAGVCDVTCGDVSLTGDLQSSVSPVTCLGTPGSPGNFTFNSVLMNDLSSCSDAGSTSSDNLYCLKAHQTSCSKEASVKVALDNQGPALTLDVPDAIIDSNFSDQLHLYVQGQNTRFTGVCEYFVGAQVELSGDFNYGTVTDPVKIVPCQHVSGGAATAGFYELGDAASDPVTLFHTNQYNTITSRQLDPYNNSTTVQKYLLVYDGGSVEITNPVDASTLTSSEITVEGVCDGQGDIVHLTGDIIIPEGQSSIEVNCDQVNNAFPVQTESVMVTVTDPLGQNRIIANQVNIFGNNQSDEVTVSGPSIIGYCGNGVKEDWEFCDAGVGNGLTGSGCTAQCQVESGPCTDYTFVKVDITSHSNQGDGNFIPYIYIGHQNKIVPENTWVPIYLSGHHVRDSSVKGSNGLPAYEHMPGLVIERSRFTFTGAPFSNKLRMVLHGGKTGLESVEGRMYFHNANIWHVQDDQEADDDNNELEDSEGDAISFQTIDDADDYVDFNFHTSGDFDDGLLAFYTVDEDGRCKPGTFNCGDFSFGATETDPGLCESMWEECSLMGGKFYDHFNEVVTSVGASFEPHRDLGEHRKAVSLDLSDLPSAGSYRLYVLAERNLASVSQEREAYATSYTFPTPYDVNGDGTVDTGMRVVRSDITVGLEEKGSLFGQQPSGMIGDYLGSFPLAQGQNNLDIEHQWYCTGCGTSTSTLNTETGLCSPDYVCGVQDNKWQRCNGDVGCTLSNLPNPQSVHFYAACVVPN